MGFVRAFGIVSSQDAGRELKDRRPKITLGLMRADDGPTRFMKKFVPVRWPLSLFLSSAAMAQHGGTEQGTGALPSTTSNLRGTNLGTAGSLSAATFPRIIRISCTRHPSVIYDRSPFY